MNVEMDFWKVSRLIADLDAQERTLRNDCSELDSVCSEISRKQALRQLTGAQLSNIVSSAKSNCDTLRALYEAAGSAFQEYYSCEQILAGYGKPQIVKASTAADNRTADEKKGIDVSWRDLLPFLGAFGVDGAIINSYISITDDPKNIGKSGAKLVDTLAGVVGKAAEGKTIDLFGMEAINKVGFKENLVAKLEGYKINNPSKTTVASKNASNVGAVAKWAGVAITGMLSFAENVEEFNADFSNPRLYVETVSETVVDTGLGLLVGAGVAALAGATAPVWAVGVVSSGVILGANLLSEALFYKDVGEFVTDSAIKLAKAAGECVEGAAKAVGKAVKGTAKKAKAAWKKIKSIF